MSIEDDEEARRDEECANAQCEMIDAARVLMDEHGYSLEDVLATIKATVGL